MSLFCFSNEFIEIFSISFFWPAGLNVVVKSDLTPLYTVDIFTNSGKISINLVEKKPAIKWAHLSFLPIFRKCSKQHFVTAYLYTIFKWSYFRHTTALLHVLRGNTTPNGNNPHLCHVRTIRAIHRILMLIHLGHKWFFYKEPEIWKRFRLESLCYRASK
jgi:hypothetical protein